MRDWFYNVGGKGTIRMLWKASRTRAFGVAALVLSPSIARGSREADLEHFEKYVRPLLASNCYACHSSDAPSVFASLRLDSRAGLLRGGDSGPAIVPGDSTASLLLQAVRGQAKALMPPTGRLGDEQIAGLAAWVDAGAPWPDEGAPGLPDPSEAFDLEKRRNAHWAWQPVRPVSLPAIRNEAWPKTGADRFILSRLEREGLEPAPSADRYTLLRRLHFALTGLPPAPEEIRAFLADSSPRAVDAVVERLLASPHFGERWARHWMDLFRYTESHGSEGDPDIPDAWRYRDYLIRALNADIPYDQIVREHIAGDLLPTPRYSADHQLNESLIGTAQYRMIEHGFQPVDPWEDRVKWTDNQIDVFSKAFQGLTVSCARCHDHKFDAISQRDYYALFGVLRSARPVQRVAESPDVLDRHLKPLRNAKRRVRDSLASLWLDSADKLADRLLAGDEGVNRALEAEACEPDSALFAWSELSGQVGEGIQVGWKRLAEDAGRQRDRSEAFNEENFKAIWRPSESLDGWTWLGTGLRQAASAAGEFSIVPEGDRIVEGINAPGVYSGLISRRHDGVLQTPRFTVDTDYISFLTQGSGFSFVRLIVENYAVPRAGIYWQRYSPKTDEPVWASWDVTYWKGFSAYVEFATMKDSTNFALDPDHARTKPKPEPLGDGRSHFGALAVAFHDKDIRPRAEVTAAQYFLTGEAPGSAGELAKRYAASLRDSVLAWREGAMSSAQAAFLDSFVRNGLLPSSLGASEELDTLVAAYRDVEREVPIFRRAPGVIDEGGPDQRLLIRGSHKQFGDPVPRRYPRNPLTARVFVNRVWSHIFGRGIVSTVDNFGRVGDIPSHPELLDYLAGRFVREGWSIKSLIRELVLSSTFQLDSQPSEDAMRIDPENALLQHMSVRRLEGEAIRDSVLAVSGRLDPALLGPSINVYYAFAKGKTKGDRNKGPLDGNGRRSVYQEIRRNAHNPFLEVFDQPKPSSTRGQRDATNVPAQSLTMLNSPLVLAQAELWGETLAKRPEPSSERVRGMFLSALGRPPGPQELDRTLGYLEDDAGPGAWSDLAHALFNLKEFLYVQ